MKTVIPGTALLMAVVLAALPTAARETSIRRLDGSLLSPDDVVTFELDGRGKAIRMVIHTGGRSIPVNKVE